MLEKYQELIAASEKILGVSFKNKELLLNALVHRSFLNEHPNFFLPNNERLEFLGDAVLELIVSEKLFAKYKDIREGELTNLRASLVNAESLGKLAIKIGLDDLVLLSKGERMTKIKNSVLADSFEALVGAIFLDSGMKNAGEFLAGSLLKTLPETIEPEKIKGVKNLLQERMQALGKPAPRYEVLEESGPDHEKVFKVAVKVEGKVLAMGTGTSKSAAEKEAAKIALKNIGK